MTREEYKAHKAAYYRANRDRILERMKNRNTAKPEIRKQIHQRRYQINRVAILEKNRDKYANRTAEQKSQRKAATDKYYQKHRVIVLERSKKQKAKARLCPEYREKEKAYAKRQHLVRAYGLTEEHVAFLKKEQNFVCALCALGPKTARGLVVDHDHFSKHVRGLLCSGCNTALGKFHDNPALLRKAADYVERFQRIVIR